MITVARIPMLYSNPELYDKEQVSFGDNLQEKLEDFVNFSSLKDNVRDPLKIGYNMFEIKIMARGFNRWDKKIHEGFCWKFNALLYSIETEEKRTSKNHEFIVIYTYIPKFVKPKYNKEFMLDWEYVNALAYP